MRSVVVPSFVLATFAAVSPAEANGHYRKYFPLKVDNQWGYERTAGPYTIQPPSPTLHIMMVDIKKWNAFRMIGFPGVELYNYLWIRFSGNTLQGWNATTLKWKPLFRFGAQVGQAYTMDNTVPLLSGAKMKITTKNLSIQSSFLNGNTFKKCIQFRATYPNGEAVQMDQYLFAPKVGLLVWSKIAPSPAETGYWELSAKSLGATP